LFPLDTRELPPSPISFGRPTCLHALSSLFFSLTGDKVVVFLSIVFFFIFGGFFNRAGFPLFFHFLAAHVDWRLFPPPRQ